MVSLSMYTNAEIIHILPFSKFLMTLIREFINLILRNWSSLSFPFDSLRMSVNLAPEPPECPVKSLEPDSLPSLVSEAWEVDGSADSAPR